jgi:hypothetical protein
LHWESEVVTKILIQNSPKIKSKTNPEIHQDWNPKMHKAKHANSIKKNEIYCEIRHIKELNKLQSSGHYHQ